VRTGPLATEADNGWVGISTNTSRFVEGVRVSFRLIAVGATEGPVVLVFFTPRSPDPASPAGPDRPVGIRLVVFATGCSGSFLFLDGPAWAFCLICLFEPGTVSIPPFTGLFGSSSGVDWVWNQSDTPGSVEESRSGLTRAAKRVIRRLTVEIDLLQSFLYRARDDDVTSSREMDLYIFSSTRMIRMCAGHFHVRRIKV
jgi:hypothetical protein